MRSLFLPLLTLTLGLSAQQPFRDATTGAGIDVNGRVRGVSVCDYDSDGHPDIFICDLEGPNLLYRNDGRGNFTEVGHSTLLANSGPAMTALWADLDNDGDQDVIIGNKDAPSKLFENTDGTFREVTASAGIITDTRVQSGVIFDYNGDGLLDIYLANFNAPNQLYRNEGNMQFRELAGNAGAGETGLAMGTLAFDYDGDGDQDLYLVHDGVQPNTLLRNDTGYFTDVSKKSGADVIGDGMGVDAADYDGDGDLDLYITNLYENFLLENLGDGTFREIGFDTKVNDLGMGWGTAFIDYDNDGRPDIYVANETNFAVGGKRYNNILYHNEGRDFSAATATTDQICSDRSGYGSVVADFDGDGREDVFVGNSNQPSQLFINTTENDHHWLSLRLTAISGNRDAIGAKIRVYGAGVQQVREIRTGGSFASQLGRTMHFGLADIETIDSVVVEWAQGDRINYGSLMVDRLYSVTEGEEMTTSIKDRLQLEYLSVYPNPFRDRLHFPQTLEDIRITDSYGRTVFSVAGPQSSVVLVNSLPPGVYHLSGRVGDKFYRSSVVAY